MKVIRIEYCMGGLWEMMYVRKLWWPTRTVQIGVN